MVAMIIPFVNIILDIIFIKVMGLGCLAALATSISYFMCFLLFWFFLYKSELRLKYILFTHNKRDYH
jgi:Na+-driven multidrug efflux pump